MKSLALRCALVLNAGLAASLAIVWLGQARAGQFWQSDFSMSYTAGRIVLDGQGQHLYDLPTQSAYQAEVVPQRQAREDQLVFNYPPHTALLAAPLALLPRDIAFFAWAVVQLVLLAWLLRMMIQMTPAPENSASGQVVPLLVVTVLAYPGLFVNFQMGQVSLLVTLALLGLVRAVEAGASVEAAAWLVVASVKPQLVLPAVVAVLFSRPRVIALAAAGFVPVVGLTVALVGPRCWFDWLDMIRLTAGQVGNYGVFPEAEFNFRGILFSLLGTDRLELINALSGVALLITLALIAWLFWRGRKAEPQQFRLRMALALQLGLLSVPHLNPTDTLVFVVPAFLLWTAVPLTGAWQPALSALLLSCPALLLADLYVLPLGPGRFRTFVAILVVLAGLMAWRVGRGKPHCEDLPASL